MILVRDQIAKTYNLDLMVHINQDGIRNKISQLKMAQKFIQI